LAVVALGAAEGRGQVAGDEWSIQMKAGEEAQRRRDYLKADAHYKVALEEAKKLGGSNPKLAMSLESLAGLSHEVGKNTTVESTYKLALFIKRKSLGPDDPQVAVTLTKLGNFYKDERRYSAAEPVFKRALEINETAQGPSHPKTAAALEDYAGVLRALKRDAEAEKFEARAKAIHAKSPRSK
jgi:tetratricopeptide (TPR) repeat protein